jgi:hypothetical protein
MHDQHLTKKLKKLIFYMHNWRLNLCGSAVPAWAEFRAPASGGTVWLSASQANPVLEFGRNKDSSFLLPSSP